MDSIFEQEWKFSSTAPLVSSKRKQYQKPGNHNVLMFSVSKKYVFFKNICKFVINFIIKRCLEAHWNTPMPAKSILTPLFYAMIHLLVPSKIHLVTLSLSLLIASLPSTVASECLGIMAVLTHYLGMGISLQMIIGKLLTKK